VGETARAVAPRHPVRERRSLIAWPGYRSGLSIASFDRRIVGAIAKPLFHATIDPALVAAALDADMGVVLPSETWRNQLPPKHEKRTTGFASLAIHRPRLQVDPTVARFRPAFAEKYASDNLDGQLGAGATLVLTAAHVHEVEAGEGRQNDLFLARLEAEEFVARRAFSPAPGRAGARELYATLIVQGKHVANPKVVDWLVAAYAGLENIGGYWIVAVNTHKSGRQLAGYLRLALELERVSERPTVTSRVGDPHLALLASGVAATCAGLHGMSFDYPPEELPTAQEDEDPPGLGVHTYARSVLGNAGVLGREGDAIRDALFANRPCPCGHHLPNQPPRGKTQIVAHNCWAVQADALAMTTPGVLAAESYLSRRVTRARRDRSFHQLSALHPGFVSVPKEAARLRQADAETGGTP
jgi:hypothetical protein